MRYINNNNIRSKRKFSIFVILILIKLHLSNLKFFAKRENVNINFTFKITFSDFSGC